MKIIFVHDHIFKCFENRYFSEGKLTDNTWERYLDFSDDLTVVSRVQYVTQHVDIIGLNETSSPFVSFSSINGLSIRDRINTQRVRSILSEKISKADLVVCRLPSFLGALAFKVAKQQKKKTVIEVVGCPYDSLKNHGSILGFLAAPLEAIKLKKIASQAESAIFVTENFLQKRYPCRGNTLTASNVELPTQSSPISINEKVEVIKFIGSLNCKYKGLDDLIISVAILKKQGLDLDLHILGSGDRSKYQELIRINKLQKHVTFFNPLKGGNAVIEWLKNGDIYVQPSHTEGLPRALIEAMSVGLPCVGTFAGGIPELIDKEFLCDIKKPQMLASKINILYESRELRVSQSRINYTKSKKYTKKVVAKKRYEFLKEVVQS